MAKKAQQYCLEDCKFIDPDTPQFFGAPIATCTETNNPVIVVYHDPGLVIVKKCVMYVKN